jgi:hypothetical protein
MKPILKAEPLTVIQKHGTESFACECCGNGNQNLMITAQISKINTMELPFNVSQF